MSTIVASPELYAADPALEPALIGRRCRACGYVFFPPQSYGCEVCGALASEFDTIALKGRGTLKSFATVHVHHGKGIEAPFTVGVIALAEGPVVRAVLIERTDTGLKIGDTMHSVLVSAGADDNANQIVELRFTKSEDGR
jgi:uncharacterized protein